MIGTDGATGWTPDDPVQVAVAEAWAKVLRRPPSSSQDDFFHAGGTSFSAALLVTRLAGDLDAEVSLRDIFAGRTVAGLADLLRDAPTSRRPDGAATSRGPATNAQRRIWFLEHYDQGELRPYNMVAAYRLACRPSEAELTAALTSVVARHSALRTAIVLNDDGDLEQQVLPVDQARPEVTIDHVRALDRAVADRAVEEQGHRFDLAAGRMLRAFWLQDDSGDAVLLLNVHHSAGDAWSSAVLLDDLIGFLRTGESAAATPMQYAAHAAWLAAYLESQAGEVDRDYWVRRLTGAVPCELPLDRPRPSIRDSRGGGVRISLGVPEDDLTRLCRQAGVTAFTVHVAALRVLLFRLTGQADVPLGTVVSNRDQPGSSEAVGLFANTVVLRTALTGGMCFREVLAAESETAQQMRQHERYPFDALVEDLGVARIPGRNPLFDVLVEPILAGPPAFREGASVSWVDIDLLVSDFDLAFSFLSHPEDEVWVRYRSDVVDQTTAARLGEQLRELLGSLVAEPDAPIESHRVLPDSQRRFLIEDVNHTAAEFPRDHTLLDLVDQQVVARPDAPAVICGDQVLSFAELDRRAERVADRLANVAAVAPEQLVAVVCERTEWMVVALLAVLKTGAAFLPLDPEQPPARLASLLSRSGAVAVLADGEYQDKCEQISPAPVIDVRDRGHAPPRAGSAAAAPTDLAYVIYTSGSTGEPKGVMIEHRGIVNTVHFRAGYYGFGPADCVLQVPPIHFDSGINDVFSALIAGTPVVVISRAGVLDPHTVAKTIERHGVTHVMLVPSLYQVLLDRLAPALRSVRQIVLVGERLPTSLAERHAELVGQTRLYNEYGPTEDSVWTTVYEVDDPAAEILIGRPISNKVVDLFDAAGDLVPLGAVGELCIGGVGLARGYLGDPDLTARRFVANPVRSGSRMYRTGDLAQRLASGELRYVGRIDDQVKIRGQRVEPGEVAAVLSLAPGVRNCAVVAIPDEYGAMGLVAYVVGDATVAALQVYLTQRVPAAMVPHRWVRLDELPITSNGKIDRRALPLPADEPDDSVAPGTVDPREEVMLRIWERALGSPVTDVDTTLFALGGHSLTAVKIANDLSRLCAEQVPVTMVFEHQTVRALTARLRMPLTYSATI